MRIRTFVTCCFAFVLIAWMFKPVEADARGGGFRGGGALAFKGGVPGFRGGWRFRGYRYGLLRYGAGAGYGVIASGGGAAADTPVTYVQVNNQIPRDGFERTVQRVCRAETYTVPSESGGTRDVTVTRCFKE
jgi:hypothetical protein